MAREKNQKEIRMYFVLNENKATTNQNLLATLKAIVKGTYIVLKTCISKEVCKLIISAWTLHN